MGMMDKFRNLMGIPEDDDMDFYDDEQDEYEDMDYVPSRKKKEKEREPSLGYDYEEQVNDMPAKRANKVVNIAATTQLSVVLVKPESFDDASTIADHLNSKRTVVLNLESASKDIARRLVDFLSGVAYANQGQIKRVANSTFIITPYNVDFVGDLLDELESNGVYF